jgi:hypothetical protein
MNKSYVEEIRLYFSIACSLMVILKMITNRSTHVDYICIHTHTHTYISEVASQTSFGSRTLGDNSQQEPCTGR